MTEPTLADAAPPPLVYDDKLVAGILKDVRTIAIVGASPNWVRPSNFAMKYLLGKGYSVIPVNPGHAGKEIWDQMTYAELGDVPGPIDMVDVFRASKDAGGIIDRAIELKDEKAIKVIWLQLGVRDDDAAARAEAAGLTV
ncbi:MAG TPA: hypothetical protein DCG48_09595, partial [Rhodospirillaceae bacterium]|nr:hypothetical protein [Rhodospirillaceae bacterium]